MDEALAAKFTPAKLSLQLRDGRSLTMVASTIPGTPGQPLSDMQLDEKAMNCFGRGPGALPKRQAAAFMNRLKKLETIPRLEIAALYSDHEP